MKNEGSVKRRKSEKEGRAVEGDELRHSATKKICHASPRCFVYDRPNIGVLGNIWKAQCPFHCTHNCWQSYRFFPCVYVCVPFKPFCGQIIKARLVDKVTSHWPQKLIFPATKYTAPADEVVITEGACSAEVICVRIKALGVGPSWESRAIIPKCVCLPAEPHLVETKGWKEGSLCAWLGPASKAAKAHCKAIWWREEQTNSGLWF